MRRISLDNCDYKRIINSIGLPSLMNVQSYKKHIRVKDTFWTSVQGESMCVVTADRKGVNFHGEFSGSQKDVIPALVLNFSPEVGTVGSRFILFGMEWVLVDDFNPVLMPVKPLCRSSFAHHSNTYETSHLKGYLDNWLDIQMSTRF